MGMAYITFKGINAGLCDAFYRTQALANAAALNDFDIVAHVGLLDVGDFQPNEAYFDGDKVVSIDAYQQVAYDALSEVNKLKASFYAFHDALIVASEFLELPSIKRYYPAEDHVVAHTMLALAHRAARGVGLSSHWTSTQKFAWLLAMAQGPTDVPFADGREKAAEQFFEIVEEARLTDSPITAPTQYFMWVNPNGALRVSLSEAGDLSTSNFAAAATDFTVFRNGGWIRDITI